MVDFSGILSGIEKALPVAEKAVNVFKKKPKAVQERILAPPQIQVIRESSPAEFSPKLLLVVGGALVVGFLLFRRR